MSRMSIDEMREIVGSMDAEMDGLVPLIAKASVGWHVNGGYAKKYIGNALIHAGIAMLAQELDSPALVACLLEGWARDLRGES